MIATRIASAVGLAAVAAGWLGLAPALAPALAPSAARAQTAATTCAQSAGSTAASPPAPTLIDATCAVLPVDLPGAIEQGGFDLFAWLSFVAVN